MTIHSEDRMNDILKELIVSGEIDGQVNDALINYFLSKPQPRTSPLLKKELQKKLMAARFKTINLTQKGIISKAQTEALSFGSYLALVKSKLKASDETIATACKIGEQELVNIINATQNIFSTSIQVITDIVDGFSIPTDILETLLKNTLAIANGKGDVSAVFPRADYNAQGITAAYDAALLAIMKSGDTPPAGNNTVDPDFLLQLKGELAKRGRKDLLH